MPNEINPNANVEREETAEVKGGEAVDFESLEMIHDSEVLASKEEKKESAKKELEEKKEDDDGAESEEAKPDEKKAAQEEAPKVEAKLVKITDGEIGHEISETAVIDVQADGRLEKVSIADLKKDYAGRVAWDRKFNELGQEKQKFNSQVQFVNDKVNEIRTMAEEDPMMAFFELCKMNNTTPDEQIKAWEKFSEEAIEWSTLSESEQNAKLAIKERDYYKKSIESDKERQARAHQRAQLDADAEKYRKLYGIDDEAYEQAEKKAPELYPQGTAIGYREVITTHRMTMTEQALKAVAPDELYQGSESFAKLFDIAMREHDFGIEDLKEIAEKTYGNQSGRKLGRKISSSQSSPAQSQRSKEEDLISFDQM